MLKYIKQLDSLRGIAILLVLFWHCIAGPMQETAFNNSGQKLKIALCWTWSGVDLFFVLSGFLIGSTLMINSKSRNYFRVFYLRRFFRILPLYYLFLIFFVFFNDWVQLPILSWLGKNHYPAGSYFFFYQNFFMAGDGFGSPGLNITWSLAVEEQFYLVLPLLIRKVSARYMPYILMLGIIMAPLLRIVVPGIGKAVLLPTRIDALFAGVMIGYLFSKAKTPDSPRTKLILNVLFLAVTACTLIHAIYFNGNHIEGILNHTLWCATYGLLVYLTITNAFFLKKILDSSWLSFIGKISFSIYLLHQIINYLMHRLILKQDPVIANPTDVLLTIFSLLTIIAVSYVTYSLIEQPFIKYGKRFKYQ